MLDLFYERHLQAGLQMLFQNISPLGDQAQPSVLIFYFDAEIDAGHFAEQNELWVLESRASLLVEGFENP